MSNQIEEFVSYEEALALKEIGFDYMCMASYTNKDTFNTGGFYYRVTPSDKGVCICPLFQQAFRWLYQGLNVKNGVMPLDMNSRKTLLKKLIMSCHHTIFKENKK